jgi:hypothetical protein
VEKLPGVVCTACEIFLKRFGPEARDFRTGRAADGYTVSKLVFRVYHQLQRDEWGPRTLDVIDRLCQEGEVMAELQQFDPMTVTGSIPIGLRARSTRRETGSGTR